MDVLRLAQDCDRELALCCAGSGGRLISTVRFQTDIPVWESAFAMRSRASSGR
jgi:hypothetical protein